MKVYPNEFKAYIENLITYCRNELWQGIYRYGVSWQHQAIDGNPKVNATIEISDVYLTFTVEIGPNIYTNWKNKFYKQVGQTILHETCHLLFYPLKRFGWENCDACRNKQLTEIDERQTQTLSVVMMGLLPKDWYMPEVVAAYMKRLEEQK